MTRGPSNRPKLIALRTERLICPASPGAQIDGIAGRQHLLREEQAAQRAELHRLVEVDVLLGLGVAVGEMRVHVLQARHDEELAVVEHRSRARRPAEPRALGQHGLSRLDRRSKAYGLSERSASFPANSVPQRTCVVIGSLPPLT